MFLSSSNQINIFASQIKTSITSTLDIHALLWSSRKRSTIERWQEKHLDDLKYKRGHFENKFSSKKFSMYKRKHKLLCKITNAVIIPKHKEFFTTKIFFQGISISWKLVNRLLFGLTVSLTKSVIDTFSISQKLQTFFIDKVNKISLNITKLWSSLHLNSDSHSSCFSLYHAISDLKSVISDEIKKSFWNRHQKVHMLTSYQYGCSSNVWISPITKIYKMSLHVYFRILLKRPMLHHY